MDHNSLVLEVKSQLEELSDPERIKWGKKNYATSMTLLGVKVPKIRPIVKSLVKECKNFPPEDVIDLCKKLNQTRILEAQQIAFELLDKHKSAKQKLTVTDLLELGAGLDNWVSVDNYAVLLAGYAWREGQIQDEIVQSWAISDDRWWRRAAVACTIPLNQKSRGGKGDSKRTLMICKLVADDKDEMVAKALSWALRELWEREAGPVIEFLSTHEDSLPKRVIREVRKKIDTGRKSG